MKKLSFCLISLYVIIFLTPLTSGITKRDNGYSTKEQTKPANTTYPGNYSSKTKDPGLLNGPATKPPTCPGPGKFDLDADDDPFLFRNDFDDVSRSTAVKDGIPILLILIAMVALLILLFIWVCILCCKSMWSKQNADDNNKHPPPQFYKPYFV